MLYTPPIPLFGAAGGGPGLAAAEAAALPTSPREPVHAALQAASAQPRRSRAGRRDPLEPKQNKTPFNFFSIDARSRAKAEHPSADQKASTRNSLAIKFQGSFLVNVRYMLRHLERTFLQGCLVHKSVDYNYLWMVQEISKLVGEMWHQATLEEKAPYVEQVRTGDNFDFWLIHYVFCRSASSVWNCETS